MGAGIRILAAFLAALAAATAGGVTAQLRQDYYAAVCPDLESIVRDAVSKKVQAQPVAVGATIRLFFHDCFVEVRGRPLSFLVPPSQSFDWNSHTGLASLSGGARSVPSHVRLNTCHVSVSVILTVTAMR
jgi:hypothetical protein